jgi:peptidoglycan/LPS O-acetylase OafA/YrhL
VVALIYRDEPLLTRLRRFKKLVALLAILLCLAIPFLIGTMSANGMLTQMYFWGHLYLSVAFSMLLLAVILTQSAPLLRSRFLKEAARYSYSLYLFHPLFISLAFEMAGRDRRFERLSDAAVALCALIFTVLFCYGLYALVERPLIDLGKRRVSYATRFRMVSSGKHPPDGAPEPITT